MKVPTKNHQLYSNIEDNESVIKVLPDAETEGK